MNQAVSPNMQAIVAEEVFPHAPTVVWKVLTNGELIGRWLMAPKGFEPVAGCHFTFQTTPAGEWDGTIHCEVLEVVANERLSYAWKGGHESNDGYGSKLETVVTFTLSKAEAGTRLRLVHSGFVLPKNDTAYRNMGEGWKKVVKKLDIVIAEEASSQTH
ncbi:SRPBCC domain-containing protein [Rhizobium calliandrae]|uniref:SRPBCC domain-containing protein n=1 Tax=Rhizobium calliandrae TaxID=1312182 RepID=A0ABT7KPF0_9HYPH|nr:SRPBCC domain-containing protein [Rhizobium calliandrae]MDL2410491.1 SRPBCC domain-containing protein [Rhizobium calliandrae]